MTQQNPLESLINIPSEDGTLLLRGGVYSKKSNVWVANNFAHFVANSSPEEREFLEACASMAFAAGAVHLQQIKDAKNGRIWPDKWIKNPDGDTLVDFCRHHPEATKPYCCVREDGAILPYSLAYQAELKPLREAVEAAAQCHTPSVQNQLPYLKALQAAFTANTGRTSDLEAMNDVDIAWVQIPTDTPLLLLAEYTENYSDPLKQLVMEQPAVSQWAKETAAANGMGPWKCFFEFRVMAESSTVLDQNEIMAVRQTNRRLYTSISHTQPSDNVKTEFRHVLIIAGHGANPPKSAKNYPNLAHIRAAYGYRNIIYANQVEKNIMDEIAPMLKTAFSTDWARRDDIEAYLMRTRAIFLVAHEETHPWVTFYETTWLEELKCDILGLWSVANTPTIQDDMADILIGCVAGGLVYHHYHEYLMEQGDSQFQDYDIGDTIFLNHLYRNGFFVTDENGMIVDVNRSQAVKYVESLARRIIEIKEGKSSAQELRADLYDPAIHQHFYGWEENRDYFENIWGSN